MSEPVRIKITPDSKMVEIPINKERAYQTRVELDMLLSITSWGEDEDIAGATAEDIAEDIAKKIAKMLEEDQDAIALSWGVRAVDDPEEIKEDDDDGEV